MWGKLHRDGAGRLTRSPLAPIPELSRSACGFALVSVLCLTLTGCVTPRAYDREYRKAHSRAMIKGAEEHLRRGEAFERAGNLQLAYEEFRAAFVQNPFQDSALLKRDLVRIKILSRSAASTQVVSPAEHVATGPISPAVSDDSLGQSPIPKVTILLDPMDLVAPVGEELSVGVVASRDLCAATFDVTFDPNLVSIVRTQFPPGAGGNCQALAREGALSVSLNGAMLGSDGLVCAIVLKAGAPGSSVLRVINGRASARDGKPLGVEPLSASVQILRLEDIPI